MQITEISVRAAKGEKNPFTKANVTLVLDGVFRVSGIRVVQGSHGLFVSWPAKRGSTDQDWTPTAEPLGALREKLDAAILVAHTDAA